MDNAAVDFPFVSVDYGGTGYGDIDLGGLMELGGLEFIYG